MNQVLGSPELISRAATPRGERMARADRGRAPAMRIGNAEVRVLGGPWGCLGMLLLSVLASIVLTVLLNVLL